MVGKAARFFGLVFVLVGIAGFIPPLAKEGMLLGLFPVSPLHNVAHILLGVWGLGAAGSAGGAVLYFRLIALIYAALAVAGYFQPVVNIGSMTLPLGADDVILHSVLAARAAYTGVLA